MNQQSLTNRHKTPPAILILGIGGTGKSSLAACLTRLLKERGYTAQLISFDLLRKKLAPPGADPFSKDKDVKKIIYDNATKEFQKLMHEGVTPVIDCGMSVESLRRQMKQSIPELKIIHVTCPLMVAMLRDTWRSLIGIKHERGQFLHLRALRDVLNPFKKEKFPQPGVTYPFEYPECADVHVNTFLKSTLSVAQEVVEKLKL